MEMNGYLIFLGFIVFVFFGLPVICQTILLSKAKSEDKPKDPTDTIS